jgi:nickel-dependent lactate racemase
VTLEPGFAERALAELPDSVATRHTPRPAARGVDLASACRAALASPVDSPPLAALAAGAQRIAVIVSDASRDEPRAEMLTALREVLPWDRVALVVASGTHSADDTIVPPQFRDRPTFVHDAKAASAMVDLGTTARGTRVRMSKVLVDSDLVVATGRIRPHYFAGFSGGLKSVFPGCAFAEDALQNHLAKADPTARLGRVDDNVCRADMEEAALRLPVRPFLLNVLCDVEGQPVAAVAGDPVTAHRSLLGLARELFVVRAPRSRVVVVADRPPVSSSLYQASKLIPPAGAILEEAGVIVVVADCAGDTGPLSRVNQGIYELGLRPQLPATHRVLLVSRMPERIVRTTYADPVDSLPNALHRAFDETGAARAVVLWRAGELVCEPA